MTEEDFYIKAMLKRRPKSERKVAIEKAQNRKDLQKRAAARRAGWTAEDFEAERIRLDEEIARVIEEKNLSPRVPVSIAPPDPDMFNAFDGSATRAGQKPVVVDEVAATVEKLTKGVAVHLDLGSDVDFDLDQAA
jgi:hypothetical protein